ncbi:MAG: N-acetyltransferase family protein [Bdellovibrionota bacterium]
MYMDQKLCIRKACSDDASSIATIYGYYVNHSVISFEYEAPSSQQMQQRIYILQEKFPWLVGEIEDQIVGYCYAGPFRTRTAYQWSAETAIYIDHRWCGKGLGKQLYHALIQELQQAKIYNIIGGITLPNEASVALHEHFGFVKTSHYKEIGFKFGQWWDVGFWQLQLDKPF